MAKSKDSGRNISDIALKPVEISVNLPTDRNDKSSKKTGLKVSRRFTKPGQDVFASVEWDTRDSIISDEKGNIISQITGIEVPKTWTQLATDIVSYKYFRKAGLPTKEGRETSVRQPIIRISKTMADFGEKFGYFASKAERETFETELMYILLHQRAAFNSPVWF
ncbi:MAG: vitamin B12-dependent ribonucleotide reductase, partial [Patescibacteria group bacterium]